MISFGSNSQRSSSTQNVWDEQTPYLTDLYNAGSNIVANQGNIGVDARNLSDRFMPAAERAIQGIGDTGYLNDVMSGNNLGMGTMARLMNPEGNPYLEQQIANMKTGIADNMRIFGLSDSADQAIMSGQFGGDRHGVSDYLVQRDAIKQATDLETQMRMGAYDTDMNRALTASQSYTGAGLSAADAERMRLASIFDPINATYNLGMSPYQAEWTPLLNQAQIVGSPTTLSSSTGSGSGFNVGYSPAK